MALLYCAGQIDFVLEIPLKAKLLSKLLQIVIGGLLDLYFHFVANTEFIFDVLCASEASKDTSTNHNTKLGRECLGLFHGVRGENDSRFFVPLRDLLNNLPHKAPCLWVHAR